MEIYLKNVIFHLNIFNILVYLLIGYFFGSIPVGYLYAKSKKVNIFDVGSKNPGSTNIKRIFGKKAGHIVFTLDVIKTVLPILLCAIFYLFNNNKELPVKYEIFYDTLSSMINNHEQIFANMKYIMLTIGLGSIIGHNFSMWTRFKGGKGITVTVGTVACFNFIYALCLYFIYKIVAKVTKYVSLGSIIALISLFLSSLIFTKLYIYPFNFKYNELCSAYYFIYMIFGIYRHKDNIIRLIKGKENRTE